LVKYNQVKGEQMDIKRENINGDTPLSTVIAYLVGLNKDKASRQYLTEFEQGVIVGKFELIDLLKSLEKKGK